MPRSITFQILRFLLHLPIHLDTKLDEHGKLLYWCIDDALTVNEIGPDNCTRYRFVWRWIGLRLKFRFGFGEGTVGLTNSLWTLTSRWTLTTRLEL